MENNDRITGPMIGSKWMEKDKRMILPAEVLGYDKDWVYLRRLRKTRVSRKRFMKHFVPKQ